MVSRNDDHGEGLLKRMSLCINNIIHFTNKYKIDTELIIVDWNPPQKRKLLLEVLPKPNKSKYLIIKYIVVPNDIHLLYDRSEEIPLFQMIGKNVGIRRANGKFILCTNIDILFTDKIMRELSKKNLDTQYFYRANRCDVPNDIDLTWSSEYQLSYCAKNIMHRLGKNPKYLNLLTAPPIVYKLPFLATLLNYIHGIKRRLTQDPVKIIEWNLDTQACGDFTLMSKEAWFDVQGYLELDLYSIHIDTLLLIAATARGYKQYIFEPEKCIYHIHHESGWESMNPVEKIKFVEKRPGIGMDLIYEVGPYMLNRKIQFDLNKDTWGFSDVNFDEYEY